MQVRLSKSQDEKSWCAISQVASLDYFEVSIEERICEPENEIGIVFFCCVAHPVERVEGILPPAAQFIKVEIWIEFLLAAFEG